MMRSLYSAVSGLKTHQTRMDVIGNNIANVNTEAFKSSRVTFSEIMYQTTSQASAGNAATGVSFPIICICNAFAWCIGDGAASYLSICAGRNDNKTTHKCIGTGISVSFMISVILSVVCLIFCKPLMVLFGASDQTTQMAVDYFRIIAAFFPVYLLGNVMNSMIRADGAPSYAMIAILSGAIAILLLVQ